MTSLGICYQAHLFSFKLGGKTIKIFLYHCFSKRQQDYDTEVHKFWFKSYDCQSIWVRRNFWREQRELCEHWVQIFFHQLKRGLSFPLYQAPWECQGANAINRCATVHRDWQSRISLKYCLCNCSHWCGSCKWQQEVCAWEGDGK